MAGFILSKKTETYKLMNVPHPRELVVKVSTYLDADKDEVLSGNRRLKNCHARDLISFVAAKSMGYKFNDISETLGIHPETDRRCAEKDKKLSLCREICFCFYFTGMTTMRGFGIF